MADPNKTYTLPPEVAMALTTRRRALLAPLINRVREGDQRIDRDLALTLLDLVGDCIDDLAQENERRIKITEQTKAAVSETLRKVAVEINSLPHKATALIDRIVDEQLGLT